MIYLNDNNISANKCDNQSKIVKKNYKMIPEIILQNTRIISNRYINDNMHVMIFFSADKSCARAFVCMCVYNVYVCIYVNCCIPYLVSFSYGDIYNKAIFFYI